MTTQQIKTRGGSHRCATWREFHQLVNKYDGHFRTAKNGRLIDYLTHRYESSICPPAVAQQAENYRQPWDGVNRVK